VTSEPYKLITEEESVSRCISLARSFKKIYGSEIVVALDDIYYGDFIATQPYLERGKLGYVLRKTVLENYNAPIIAAVNVSLSREFKAFHEGLYIIDGHHRAFVGWLIDRDYTPTLEIQFRFPKFYKPRREFELWSLKTIEDNVQLDERLRIWRRMAGIIVFYVNLLEGRVHLEYRKVNLDSLIPAQRYLEKSKIKSVINEPILILQLRNGSNYILDGHARCWAAKNIYNKSVIDALVLKVYDDTKIGMVDVAKSQGLRSLNDMELV